ncbi:MAG TPA: TerB family tellurite resistance protein [Sphingomonadales bacterium]|nr:TerB family tellurite resistance protein [Sphingomonadales bacterium]
MANRIKALFKSLKKGEGEKLTSFSDKDLAAAALLVEAASMDGTLAGEEGRVINRILTERFHLSKEEARALFKEAQTAQEEATHLMRFTRTIKDNYSETERIGLIEMLWEVAFADGVIHDYEDNLIRRVAGLIYVSDFDRGEAKKRVRERIEEASSTS